MNYVSIPNPPPITVRRIFRSYLSNESGFRTSASAEARAESLVDAVDRMLLLQQSDDFLLFFSFLSHRSPDLISPCHWLAFGPKLAQGNGTPSVPTFVQLQRVIQLVREERPQLQVFTRQLIAGSVLGKIVGPEPAAPNRGLAEVSSPAEAVAR